MHYVHVITRMITGQDDHRLVYHSTQALPIGTVVRVPLGRRSSLGLVVDETKKPTYPTRPAEQLLNETLPREYIDFLLWLAEYYATPPPVVVAQVLSASLGRSQRVTSEARQSLVTRSMAGLSASAIQQAAVSEILATGPGAVVLHGETASGKTLVYREVAKQTLASGRSVLILVPEIGLTTQVASDFQDLSEHIFISHSELKDTARRDIWLKILQQKPPYIVIGPRSALLTPLRNLGLVVIDEAHETAYKNDGSPRYQTTTAAAYLTQRHQARLILGSATPRITDYYLASSKARPILRLPRHHPAKVGVMVVDQRHRSVFSTSFLFSNPLLDALSQTLAKGRQSLLYINRRGTAPLALCSNCGWSAGCPRCSLSLTLHHDLEALLCHQCGWREAIPTLCPVCHRSELVFRGAGTKRVERELAKLLPAARLARFDSDSLRGQRLNELYQAIHDGQIDILIGTQSVAKGLDLPKLDTVGVVSADSELHLPDFAAAERTFQLLYQVIGRAGRTSSGQAIIQTYHPDHPAIAQATAGDFLTFYEHELASRAQHGYPPFRHLLALIYRARSRAKAQSEAEDLAAQISRQDRSLVVLGPAPAYYEHLGRYYRWTLVVKSARRPILVELANHIRQKHGWQVDLDPINLLY